LGFALGLLACGLGTDARSGREVPDSLSSVVKRVLQF